MDVEAVQTNGEPAPDKLTARHRSLIADLVRAALTGLSVGVSIALIFTIGGLPGIVIALGVRSQSRPGMTLS